MTMAARGIAAALGFIMAGVAVGPLWAAMMAGAVDLSVPLSVRQAGMGGVSAGGSDLLGGWCNPALLGRQESRWELAAGGVSRFGEENLFILGAGWAPLPAWSLAILGMSSGISANELDEYGRETGTSLSRSLAAGGVAGAWGADWYGLGLAGKLVSEEVGDSGASGALVDLGAEARRWGFSLSAALRNLGGELEYSDAVSVEVPTEARCGLAYLHEPWRACVGVEYAKVRSLEGMVGLGAEWWPARMLAVRAGYAGETGAGSVTAGLTVLYRGLALDYAMSTHDIGTSNLLGLTWALGGERAAAGI